MGAAPNVGTAVASFDGGQKWEAAADTALGWGGYAPLTLLTGRDGRLYAGTDWGVYRTVEAVPTAAEPGAPASPDETGAVLGVHPNPFRGGATIALTLAAPSHVRLSVHDGLGREVALLHDGPLSGGVEHRFTFDGSSLARRVYVARAVGKAFADACTVVLTR